jgi:hypothetical protein
MPIPETQTAQTNHEQAAAHALRKKARISGGTCYGITVSVTRIG